LTSTKIYAHLSRSMGDAMLYFEGRGSVQKPGPIVSHLLAELRPLSDGSQRVPTVVVTHSLGCSIFYDLFTHFNRELQFDLWVSVGSQLSLHEDIGILASSRKGDPALPAGRPGPAPVELPAGAAWYNFFDPNDPLAYPSEGVFEHVRDVQR